MSNLFVVLFVAGALLSFNLMVDRTRYWSLATSADLMADIAFVSNTDVLNFLLTRV